MDGNEVMTYQGSRREGTEWSAASTSAKESSKVRTGRVSWISYLGGHSVERWDQEWTEELEKGN